MSKPKSLDRVRIEPLCADHFEALLVIQDTVFREKRFFSFTSRPPKSECLKHYKHIVGSGICAHVALIEGQMVGWCDIHPYSGDACQHVGLLTIGLVASARCKGIGSKLLELAIRNAQARGLSRIELEVRTDNSHAVRLYEKLGFKREGVSKGRYLVDGVYHDLYRMALIADA